MDNLLTKLFKTPETRERVFRTLVLLVVYRLGFQIPIPGTDPKFLQSTADQGIMGMLSALSGGAIGQTTVFALGIMPYISASIIFSMLTKVSPALEAISKEGAAGQKRINQWTRLAVVPIALIQAILVYTGVFLAGGAQMVDQGMRHHHVALFCIVVFSLIAGSMLVMWIGELITEYGVGNGASLIIMAGIIAVMPSSFASITSNPNFWQILMFLTAVWVVVIFAVVFMHKGARRVPIQYARLTRGRRVYGGQRHYLPIKVNMAGVMPIIFASVLFVIPTVLFKWVGWHSVEGTLQDTTGFVHVSFYLVLIFSFCFFWNRLMFQPEEIANNLREHGSFVPGIRPGQKTAEYLSNVLTRVTLVGAAFLALVAVLPAFITKDSGMTRSMQYFVTGTSVLIVVGVALELMDKLQAQLVMKTYEGTEEGAQGQGQARWAQSGKGKKPSQGGAK
ncbi:MAG: preprotein translocase subunit SecY [Planctomycetes bacterium]|nr:preprotein translocase subunit SecY [Planctomycetota bacterium]MCB9910382.1 preprotein translocase subunit SecY [Planctomycetota bacterium]MCB9912007.1 preprotein translocase subunit SecY [Planctomycetota bacterium]HPF14079.1 preprotein translocase subunit SecY [Planctomycetota bacterium]HRV79961.1 preprotein translocase subunit SecY [Planctomycetota bacterium]